MALIQCTECGHTVSDRAEICPGCGCPVKLILQDIEQQKAEAAASLEEKRSAAEEKRERNGCIFDISDVYAPGGVKLSCHFCGGSTTVPKSDFYSATSNCCTPKCEIKCPSCRRTHRRGVPIYTASMQEVRAPEEEKPILCPHCGSGDFDIVKEGFAAGKAAVGGFLLGPLGVLAGASGSNNIQRICRRCGTRF